MVKKYFSLFAFSSYLLIFLLIPTKSFAQCAGLNSSTPYSVCDIPNATSQTISLFALLEGTPVADGTWSDDDNSGGLNTTTGILNAQVIPLSGKYHYTYTVTGVNGCADNSATVEVIIGGYSGIAEKALACSDDHTFNLFQIFNGSTHLSPQSGGYWYNDTDGIAVASVIDAAVLEIGKTSQFTYSIPAIGSCPAVSSTGFVTVYKSPEPGIPAGLTLCEDSDFSIYSNLDLNDRLNGEDAGGTWKDDNGTGQITFTKDHNVDVQSIFNNYGVGTYNFTYTVLPTSPVCDIETATFTIKIEKKFDFTGAKLEVKSDICESEISTATYLASLTQGIKNIPNGQFYVTYNVSGPNGETKTILASFKNGVYNFPLSRNYFQQPGDFTVTITKIDEFGSEGSCVNIINNLFDVLRVYPRPDLDGAILTPFTTCQNKSTQALISNATRLANGAYTILYNVSGANTATAQTATINVSGGNANFPIPSNLNSNSGNSIITITNITNAGSPYCSNTANLKGNLIINKLPDAANLKIEVLDDCLNKPFLASVTGLGTLTNVTISYLLSGNNSAVQTITLAVTDGKANFTIPSNLLQNTGSTIISITNLINNDTTCDINLTTIFDTFSINAIPVAPIAGDQPFCKVDGATIANLLPNGDRYKWYNSSTLATPLPNTYVLKSEDYWVTETSTAGCISDPTMITVTVSDSPAPILDSDGQNFCGLENPTILNLSNNTNVTSTVVWYDAASNGNLLASTTPLRDNATYYGFDLPTATNCISQDHIEVKVSLSHCDDSEYETFFVPDGFSPNGDNVNDTFTILKIDFLYPDYSLEIYNRYGNVLFKGNKNKPDWDGRNSEGAGFGDGIAPNGVYFYVIHFNKDNKSPQQGRLYLNR